MGDPGICGECGELLEGRCRCDKTPEGVEFPVKKYTVGELIAVLEECDPDALVVVDHAQAQITSEVVQLDYIAQVYYRPSGDVPGGFAFEEGSEYAVGTSANAIHLAGLAEPVEAEEPEVTGRGPQLEIPDSSMPTEARAARKRLEEQANEAGAGEHEALQ